MTRAERPPRKLSPVFARVIRQPRLIKIVLVLIVSVAVGSLADRLDPSSYYADTRTATFTLSVVAGVIAYIVGWAMLIGFSGEDRAERRGVGAYLIAGVTAVVIALLLVLLDVVSSSA